MTRLSDYIFSENSEPLTFIFEAVMNEDPEVPSTPVVHTETTKKESHSKLSTHSF
jgi:hypothetical protein